MIDGLLRLLGLWGLADSLWLAIAPRSWARFWGRWITKAEAGGAFPRLLAVAEFAFSLALACGMRRRWLGR